MYILMQNEIGGLKPDLGFCQNQKQLLEQEQLKLRRRMEIIQNEIMLKDGNNLIAWMWFYLCVYSTDKNSVG